MFGWCNLSPKEIANSQDQRQGHQEDTWQGSGIREYDNELTLPVLTHVERGLFVEICMVSPGCTVSHRNSTFAWSRHRDEIQAVPYCTGTLPFIHLTNPQVTGLSASCSVWWVLCKILHLFLLRDSQFSPKREMQNLHELVNLIHNYVKFFSTIKHNLMSSIIESLYCNYWIHLSSHI